MASIDDYTSGKVLQEAGRALSILKASDDSLAGTKMGELLMAEVGKYAPRLMDLASAAKQIRAAHRCAVGPRLCCSNNHEAEFTESVFLDELAEGMVTAGKARTVSSKEAIDTLAKYEKNPLVMSEVSGKPMELCRTSPETCVYWNMEKRGLRCLHRKPSAK